MICNRGNENCSSEMLTPMLSAVIFFIKILKGTFGVKGIADFGVGLPFESAGVSLGREAAAPCLFDIHICKNVF